MKKQTYELHLKGLPEADGEIQAQDLQKVLSALLRTAECATRLLALGEGSSKGVNPAWLTESLNVTVTSLKPGCTALAMTAPLIYEVAEEQFSQDEFWRSKPHQEDTALDLAAYAIQELTSNDAQGDRYDPSVINAVLEFKKVARASNIIYAFHPKGTSNGSFTLKSTDYSSIADKKSQIPKEQSFTVSGKLDEIRHTAGQFRLLLSTGQKLLGKIDAEFLDQQSLKSFWGKDVTVEGMVAFKANGTAQIIHARKLTEKVEGDELFEKLPRQEQVELFPKQANQYQNVKEADPMRLWGLWEGNESIEELLIQLD